jgi:hypothetical protein
MAERRSRGDWTARFLEVFRQTGTVRLSADAAGIDRDTAYKRRRRDPRFAARWERAEQDGVDVLAAEARRRGLGGSDQLLMFLLRAHRPDVYGPRVDVAVTLRSRAEAIATAAGLDVDELLAEAERISEGAAPRADEA